MQDVNTTKKVRKVVHRAVNKSGQHKSGLIFQFEKWFLEITSMMYHACHKEYMGDPQVN